MLVEISICISVYRTEPFLTGCLDSIPAAAGSCHVEVIVVDDGSIPPENSPGSAVICREFQRRTGIPVRHFVHSRNEGLCEARRTAVRAATGAYICILDSDDTLLPGSLNILYREVQETGGDIIHGTADVVAPLGTNVMYREQRQQLCSLVHPGFLSGHEVFRSWLVHKQHTGFLWGKLIQRQLSLKALEQIPSVFCTMGEDTLQYFFISYHAGSYIGIRDSVYRYRIETGVSSRQKIDSLDRWIQVCSAASVFTVLYTWVSEQTSLSGISPLTEDERIALQHRCRMFLVDNIRQLRTVVVPELQPDARDLLCDYWGGDFVAQIEALLPER